MLETPRLTSCQGCAGGTSPGSLSRYMGLCYRRDSGGRWWSSVGSSKLSWAGAQMNSGSSLSQADRDRETSLSSGRSCGSWTRGALDMGQPQGCLQTLSVLLCRQLNGQLVAGLAWLSSVAWWQWRGT